MGRIETETKPTRKSRTPASNFALLEDVKNAVDGWEQKLEQNPLKLLSINNNRPPKLDDPYGFDHAMETFTHSAQIMSDHVVASIAPLCSISAMGDRIDRLNRENAEALDKLINGRL